jgi:hypothetical protein
MYFGFYPLMDSSLAYRVEIKALKEEQGERRSREEASTTKACFDVLILHLLIDHLVFPYIILSN